MKTVLKAEDSETKIFMKIRNLAGGMFFHARSGFLGMDANYLGIVWSNPKVMVLKLTNVREGHSFGADKYNTMDPRMATDIRSKAASMEETTGHYHNIAFGEKEK